MGSRQVYSKVLIDHFKNPVNRGRLTNETCLETGYNPKCGDVIYLSLRMDRDRVEEVMFDGKGCMICLASASILAGHITNMPAAEIHRHIHEVMDMFSPDPSFDENLALHDEIKALSSVREFPTRSQCATLAWQTLGQALRKADR
ncbi:MAG: SUF system NifU family Fe-S cluster assembly protein [Balneolales bacterium]